VEGPLPGHLLFVGVLSGPKNFQRRALIRQSWMDALRETNASVRVEFIIGHEQIEKAVQGGLITRNHHDVEMRLEEEAKKHGDINRIPVPESPMSPSGVDKVFHLFSLGVEARYRYILKLGDDQKFTFGEAWVELAALQSQYVYVGHLLATPESTELEPSEDDVFHPYFESPSYAFSWHLAHLITKVHGSHTMSFLQYGSFTENLNVGKWVAYEDGPNGAVKFVDKILSTTFTQEEEDAAPAVPIFTMGEAWIKPKKNPLYCWNVEFGLNKGARVILWPCGREPNALFRFAEGTLRTMELPELCFNKDPAKKKTSSVVTGQCGEKETWQWELFRDKVSGKHRIFREKGDSNLCLSVKTVKHNAELSALPCDDQPEHSLFTMDYVVPEDQRGEEELLQVFEAKPSVPVTEPEITKAPPKRNSPPTLRLQKDSSFCLDAMNTLEIGAPLILWKCNDGPNELFRRVNDTLRTVELPELCVNSATAVGTYELELGVCGQDTFRFDIKNGYLTAPDQTCLGISKNRVESGTPMRLRRCNSDSELQSFVTDSVEAFGQTGGPTVVKRLELSSGLGILFYLNCWASSFLDHRGLRMDGMPERRTGFEGIVAQFPRRISKGNPTQKQLELYAVVKRMHGACYWCAYPALNPYSPFRLMTNLSHELLAGIVANLVQEDHMQTEKNAAVVHLRCDPRILEKHHDYGFVPHRFVWDRLPSEVRDVVLVGSAEAFDAATHCGRSALDLEAFLQERSVSVRIQTGTARHDWLFLATAPLLFCHISAFCFSAALANPNTVFIAANSDKTAVVAPGSKLGPVKHLLRPGFRFVETDFIPGTSMAKRTWPKLQHYLRSLQCNQAADGCLPAPHE